MLALGAKLAALCVPGVSIYFSGPLGAGKTTLVRGILSGLGHVGRVKSPSYSLVESYLVGGLSVYHIDLYRLTGEEEIENLGLRDYMDGQALCLLEWPERASCLPVASVHIDLTITGENERLLAVRRPHDGSMKRRMDELILNS